MSDSDQTNKDGRAGDSTPENILDLTPTVLNENTDDVLKNLNIEVEFPDTWDMNLDDTWSIIIAGPGSGGK